MEDKKPLSSAQHAKIQAQNDFEEAFDEHMAGRLDVAISLYEKSVRVYPTARAFTNLGWALSEKREFEKAIECCQKAIEIDPDYGNPYNDIGAYLIELGQEDESIKWFEKAILAKDYDALFFPFFNLGKVYEFKNMLKKAVTCYEKALAIKPDFEPATQALNTLTKQLN